MNFYERIESVLLGCKEKLQGPQLQPDHSERFLLTSPCTTQNNLKCVVALRGDVIYEADIKVLKANNVPYKATIKEGTGSPYRIQQIQDCLNFTEIALNLITVSKNSGTLDRDMQDKTFLVDLFNVLRDARNVLTLPRRKSIEEHISNPSRKCFHPPVPKDTALSIFIRGHKLVFAAYILLYNPNTKRFEITTRYTVECVIPWINDVIRLLTFALETCLQMMAKT